MVNVQFEIDLVIKQANRYIDYINKNGTYAEFAHDFLRLADKSQIKQNFNYLKQYLAANSETQPEEFLQMILDFDGIIAATQNQEGEAYITNENYNSLKQYWNEAQQNLKDRDLYSY
tara:strand:- start:841 stop:1191 length:351 start_codon:yes stop_codon:yes gene_type:complete